MSNSFELVEVGIEPPEGPSTLSVEPQPVINHEVIQQPDKPETDKPKPKTRAKPKAKPQQPGTEQITKPKAKPKARAPPIVQPKPEELETIKEVENIIINEETQVTSKPKLQEKQECPHCKKLMSLKVLRYTHPNKCTVLNKVMKKTINKNTKPENTIIDEPKIIEAPKIEVEQKEPVIMKNKYELKNEKIDKIFSFLKN